MSPRPHAGGTPSSAPAPGPRCSSGPWCVDHADTAELVALRRRQPGPDGRAQPAGWRELGAPPGADVPGRPTSPPMLDKERVDVVAGHHAWTSPTTSTSWPRCDAGRDVVTEKPMTVDAAALPAHPRRGRPTPAGGSRSPSTTATTRCTRQVRELLADGAIGEIGSVHFEWLLDVRHGADYFRRWHRDKANSGGLLVHKASHHFDLVNWWLGADARSRCTPPGRLFFYGEDGRRHGYARDYDRAHGAPAAADDPFALRPGRPTRGCASSTSTPRPTTATSATATSSPPA